MQKPIFFFKIWKMYCLQYLFHITCSICYRIERPSVPWYTLIWHICSSALILQIDLHLVNSHSFVLGYSKYLQATGQDVWQSPTPVSAQIVLSVLLENKEA